MKLFFAELIEIGKSILGSFFTISTAQILGVYFINVLGTCISGIAVAACIYFANRFLNKHFPNKKNEDK